MLAGHYPKNTPCIMCICHCLGCTSQGFQLAHAMQCCTKHSYLIKQHLFMQKLTHKQLQREATQRLNEFMGQIRNQPSVDLSAKNLGEEGCSYVAEALAFNDRCTRPAQIICTYLLTTYMMGYTCFTPAQTQNASCYSPRSGAGCSSKLLLACYICLSVAVKVDAAFQQDATIPAICHLSNVAVDWRFHMQT